MEDEGRLDSRHWDTFEQCVKDNPGLKLMSVLAERDAAILDRNTAFAEKKAAYAEREAAFLQRDVAFADRNSAISERDAAVAALDYARDNSWNGQRSMPCGTLPSAKFLHVLTEYPSYGAKEYQTVCAVNAAAPAPASEAPPSEEPEKATKPAPKTKGDQGLKESSSKRKSGGSGPKTPRPKQQRKHTATAEDDVNGQLAVVNHEQKNQDLVINGNVYDISTIPIPVCSCTGVLQQCYRWGSGGWQSACCTTSICMYPLPMNPKRRGARVAGRKMSGGAFRKVVERLAAEGHDLAYPIDLKTHWAKHGTNKFVTIR